MWRTLGTRGNRAGFRTSLSWRGAGSNTQNNRANNSTMGTGTSWIAHHHQRLARAYDHLQEINVGTCQYYVLIHQQNFVNPNYDTIHTQNVENMWSRAKQKLRRQLGSLLRKTCCRRIYLNFSWGLTIEEMHLDIL